MAIAERILQARKAAGLTQQQVADRAGSISKMSISKYENGVMTPSSPVLRDIARALAVNVEYFFRSDNVRITESAHRKKSMGKRDLDAIEGRIQEVVERYVAVEQAYGPSAFKPFSRKLCRHVETLEDCEQAAQDLRQSWALGHDAIGNLCETLEAHGVKVVLMDLPGGFDGYCCWVNDSIPVVVAPSEDTGIPGDRQRFTMAHELGHLMLCPPEGLTRKRKEALRNRFAGALLAAGSAVIREVGDHRTQLLMSELYSLKHRYGMSMHAWVCRMLDLDVIALRTYIEVKRTFKRSGWLEKEPGDPVDPEKTDRFSRLARRAAVEERISLARASELLGVPLVDVRRDLAESEWGPELIGSCVAGLRHAQASVGITG